MSLSRPSLTYGQAEVIRRERDVETSISIVNPAHLSSIMSYSYWILLSAIVWSISFVYGESEESGSTAFQKKRMVAYIFIYSGLCSIVILKLQNERIQNGSVQNRPCRRGDILSHHRLHEIYRVGKGLRIQRGSRLGGWGGWKIERSSECAVIA